MMQTWRWRLGGWDSTAITKSRNTFTRSKLLNGASLARAETSHKKTIWGVHQNRASPFASDFSPQSQISQGIPQWESTFAHLHRRGNRRSLAMFGIARKSRILGPWDGGVLRGVVKIAAATADAQRKAKKGKSKMGAQTKDHQLGSQVLGKRFNWTLVRTVFWRWFLFLPSCPQNCAWYPLQIRVQWRSRPRLRIVGSIAFLFRACFKRGFTHYSTTVARLSFLGDLAVELISGPRLGVFNG